jgi:hypothetical protein
VTGSRIRVMAGMGVLGLALAIGAAFLAEGRGERSAAQRVASRPVIADPPPPLVVRPRVAMTRRPAPNAAAGRTRA